RARVDAARAAPARARGRIVERQLERRQEFREQEVGAECRGQHAGALREEPDAGADRERAFEHRQRVGPAAHRAVRHALAFEPVPDRAHALAEVAVVVAPDRVARDPAAALEGDRRAPVVPGERDRAARLRQPGRGIGDPVAVALEVVHLPGAAGVEPGEEAVAVGTRMRRAELDDVEAGLERQLADELRGDAHAAPRSLARRRAGATAAGRLRRAGRGVPPAARPSGNGARDPWRSARLLPADAPVGQDDSVPSVLPGPALVMEAPHPVVTEDLRERLLALWERTGDPGLHRIAAGEPCAGAPDELPSDTLPPEEQDDWISTTLMGAFRDTGDPQVFALLYELNEARFLQAIRYKLRRSGALLDAHDVLQEVFLNIYRYPNRFVAERADAFRNWGHRIVRNTLLKFLKNESRRACIVAVGDEHLGEFPDARMRTPYRSAEEAELAQAADRAFLLYLSLYLVHFEKL